METISEIVADMRKRFEPYAKSDSNDARYVAYLGYAEFADRIEQVVTNCNQLKMREALVELIANIEMRSSTFGRGDIPDAGEQEYISKRVTDKFPTAELVRLERRFRPLTSDYVIWEFKWVVYNYKRESEVQK